MGRDEHDLDSERSTRTMRQSTQRTDRLDPHEAEYGEPIRQDWRSSRASRSARRMPSVPSSRQEFVLWLQHGGMRTLLVIAGVAAIAILVLILIRPRQPLQTPISTPEPAGEIGARIPTPEGSVTPLPSPSAAPTAQAGGAQFKVVNTGAEGLFLRPEPNRNNQPIKTLPDGTIVTVIGEDSIGSDYTWKHVRDSEGAEGWVAADFLQQVP